MYGKWVLVCLWALTGLQAVPVFSQSGFAGLRNRLQQRMDSCRQTFVYPLPPLTYRPGLVANASYDRDTIWVGDPQAEFQTEDDLMSIIYHEYWHYVYEQQGRFPIRRDSSGKIIQWMTDEFYIYHPSEEEVISGLEAYEAELHKDSSLTEVILLQLVEAMEATLSAPQRLPFLYAPSNLAQEEIQAYTQQLEGEGLGLYRLSETAREAIRRRIAQLQDTYRRRRAFEKRNGIGPDGRR